MVSLTMQGCANNQELMITAGPDDVVRIDGKPLPPILAEAGAETWQHFVEYFTAHIHYPNTQAAYGRAVLTFFWWCEAHERQARDAPVKTSSP